MATRGFAFIPLLALLPVPAFSAELSCPTSFHCPTTLATIKDEKDGQVLTASARSLLVLIHGWTVRNPDDQQHDSYSESFEWSSVVSSLKVRLAGSSTKLVEYHWEEDASTGPWTQDFFGYGNATEVAANAFVHGPYLGTLLHQPSPDLRSVHFIAHSAGSWTARQAAETLLAVNPFVVIQITLLDPFIPDASLGLQTGLSTELMSQTAQITGAERIYRLENYYAVDYDCLPKPTLSTQERFAWRTGRDLNLRVDWSSSPTVVGCSNYYFNHSGPIKFYADTVLAGLSQGAIPIGLYGLLCPFAYNEVGWYKSLHYDTYLFPRILSQPTNQSVTVPGGLSLTPQYSANDFILQVSGGVQPKKVRGQLVSE